GDKEKCLAAGMSDYISKPIKLDRLEYILKKYIPHLEKRKITEKNSLSTLGPKGNQENTVQDKLMTLFQEECQRLLSEFQEALEKERWDSLQTIAHQIKGICLMYQIEGMSDWAVRLDQHCKAEQKDQAHGVF